MAAAMKTMKLMTAKAKPYVSVYSLSTLAANTTKPRNMKNATTTIEYLFFV